MIKLSYSSLKTLQSCESKLWHYKIASTPKDPDYEESEALGFGKAFHQVLETTMHNSYNEILINQAMQDNKVEVGEKMLLEAMLKKYVEYHKMSGLKVVICELPVETPDYIGFIDAIAIDQSGGFWIIDLKTASRHDESLLANLSKDLQLNLYSYFSDTISRLDEISGREFRGCRYRQVIKSKAGTLSGLEKGVKVYDIEIPASMLNPQLAKEIFEENLLRLRQLESGEAPKKNYNNCMSYFRPCEYFSQCHGDTFTNCKSKVKVHTTQSMTDGELL